MPDDPLDPRLSEEERRLVDALSALPDEQLLARAGLLAWAESGVAGAAPPDEARSAEMGKSWLERSRAQACTLLSRSPAVRVLTRTNEVADGAAKLATLIAILRPGFQALQAVVLAVLVVRHGLRWLCPGIGGPGAGHAAPEA